MRSIKAIAVCDSSIWLKILLPFSFRGRITNCIVYCSFLVGCITSTLLCPTRTCIVAHSNAPRCFLGHSIFSPFRLAYTDDPCTSSALSHSLYYNMPYSPSRWRIIACVILQQALILLGLERHHHTQLSKCCKAEQRYDYRRSITQPRWSFGRIADRYFQEIGKLF